MRRAIATTIFGLALLSVFCQQRSPIDLLAGLALYAIAPLAVAALAPLAPLGAMAALLALRTRDRPSGASADRNSHGGTAAPAPTNNRQTSTRNGDDPNH